MPALATTGGRRRLLVVLQATPPPSAGNWQQQQLQQGYDSGLSPGERIGMWVLFSITILFIIIGLWRMLCRSSRIYDPGPQISGEGIRRERRQQQATAAADIELAPAPVPALALALECTYRRSADGWAEQTCSVCLSELADGDMVRVLMVCRHCFHTACIEQWLRERDTCPLCRTPTTAIPDRNVEHGNGNN